ncbi:MAG TPA: thiamine-phosphate kinase [Pirellulaceae bacterium]|nr:thiamine-phosphate kinase [Pirellulaceae bacterium]
MEAALIQWLRTRLPQNKQVLLGIGDDAAVLQPSAGSNLVVTTDMLMDGVDFILSEVDPRRVGRKSLAVNLSDLAAMAAKPVAAFISLALPRVGGAALAKELYEGLLPLADEFQCAIAGGDTNSWDGPLVITVTAIGETTARGPLVRSGAQPGDAILVTGPLGGSLAGHHFDFDPRVQEALWLHDHFTLHAGTDISDGLSIDLSHLCLESGVGAIVDEASLPKRTPKLSTAQMLNDGEDFELILAVPAAEAERLINEQPLSSIRLTRVGMFAAGQGMQLRGTDGLLRPLVPAGYQHKLEG